MNDKPKNSNDAENTQHISDQQQSQEHIAVPQDPMDVLPIEPVDTDIYREIRIAPPSRRRKRESDEGQ